jgi:acetyl-CoA carboxylase biotin carboxyl carrier protein
MMELKKIREIIRLIQNTDVEEIEVWDSEDRVRIRRSRGNGHDPDARANAVAPAPAPAAAPAPAPAAAPGPQKRQHTVVSPFVGTFYRAASPGADSFVEVGARVRKGQTLCIVEAMKLMNEIEAEVDGVVAEILAQNGQAVEYGQPLFRIELA